MCLSTSSEDYIVCGAVRALRDHVEALSDAVYRAAVSEVLAKLMGLNLSSYMGWMFTVPCACLQDCASKVQTAMPSALQ